MSDSPRISFDQSELSEEELTPTKGVKLDRKRSFLKEKPTREEFFDQVDEIQKKKQEMISKTFELSQSFKDLMKDKTVPSQKSTLQQSKENEIISKLIGFANELNTDQTEDEGIGSVTLLGLVFKIIIQMRDEYNDLHFKHHQLEKYTSRLEEKLNALSSELSNDKQSK